MERTHESTNAPSEFTQSELQDLERMINMITPGPWHVPEGGTLNEVFLVFAKDPETALPIPVAHTRWPIGLASNESTQATRNANFIALSRNVMPRLVQALRQQKEEIELLKSIAELAEEYLGTVDALETRQAINLSTALGRWTHTYGSDPGKDA